MIKIYHAFEYIVKLIFVRVYVSITLHEVYETVKKIDQSVKGTAVGTIKLFIFVYRTNEVKLKLNALKLLTLKSVYNVLMINILNVKNYHIFSACKFLISGVNKDR